MSVEVDGKEFANNVLTIGAINHNFGEKMVADFSNFGATNVDIFSPGVKIYATIPDGKYKYEISKINWQQTSVFPIERWKDTASPSFDPAYAYYLEQTDLKIKEVIAALEKHIRVEVKDTKGYW